jgi:Skp family chaperone for outer membrane proteins
MSGDTNEMDRMREEMHSMRAALEAAKQRHRDEMRAALEAAEQRRVRDLEAAEQRRVRDLEAAEQRHRDHIVQLMYESFIAERKFFAKMIPSSCAMQCKKKSYM